MGTAATVVELIGVASAAISGAMVAIEKKADVFGILFLALISALGGGILRDILLGYFPPRMFTSYSYLLVVFVSAIAFFVCYLAKVKVGWLSFVYAVPVGMILLVEFSHIWSRTLWQAIAVSLLDWTLCGAVYISFVAIAGIKSVAMIFLVAGVFQVLIILWYVLMLVRRRNRARKESEHVLS